MKNFKKVILGVALIGLWMGLGSSPVQALPSFARQTGMSCAACHTVFPELTTYGRTFKLNGYTTNNSDSLKDGSDDTGYRLNISNTPPIAAMLQVADSFVKTPPGNTTNGASDNMGSVEFPSQFSLFYAGAISPKLGAFLQFTYSMGSGKFGMDNTDVRLADRFQVANTDLVLGLTLNNNPTVQDIFNTVPAWGFPYTNSQTAGIMKTTPGAAAMITKAGGSVGGLGAYAFWNQLLYAEFSLYRSIPTGGILTGSTDIQGYAPYWRLALTKDFDKHSIEVGGYGMDAHVYPEGVAINYPASPQDDYNDVAVDAQYQYVGKDHQLTLKGTTIWETQNLGYSTALAAVTTNPKDTLTTYKVDLTYYYDRKIGFTVGYFNTTGSSDPALYAPAAVTGYANNVPDTNGMVFEVNYVPWYNTKFSAQYTYYNKFNGDVNNYDGQASTSPSGTGRFATDNNTLMFMAWLMY